MSRVLVTGATGFVGRHLVARLLELGHDVVGTSRTVPKEESGISWLPFDLENQDSISRQHLESVDCIFHLAAQVHVMRPGGVSDDSYERVNHIATRDLAARAAAAGVRRFVFLSTIKVNGERTDARPFRATDTPCPSDAYARSKLRAEQSLLEIADKSGMEAIVVRPPLIYGPGVRANFERLLALAHRGYPIPLGRVENRRSLLNVWNLVDWLILSQRHAAVVGKVWLVSDGIDVSTHKLVELMASGMGKRAHVVAIPLWLLRAAGLMFGRQAEVGRLVESLQLDIAETCAATGWTPPVSLEDGVARTAKWYAERARAQ